jgi:diguanylate cyclase
MKFFDDSSKAAGYLRQAIPKMVKHNIVPNPLNYTLWYSYFSNTFPMLNRELDQVIERYGTCPPKISESLFLQHISQIDDKSEERLQTSQHALSHLIENLSDSLDHTAKQTDGYSVALKDNITALEEHNVDAAMLPILSALNANANAICDVNQQFFGELSSAQSEIQRLRAELAKSRHEANIDPLTGLCNRRVLEAIYREFMQERQEDEPLSLIIMDVDKFKIFNDTHGHVMGDQVLKYVGDLLKKECSDKIVPVRFGGEEFAILCPQFSSDSASEMAEKIRMKLSLTQFKNRKTGTNLPPITASFGLATQARDEELTQLIERADKALYRAKDQGRNRVQTASA